jgi:pimeloyl-ACP methyl ester carboxylesterase
VGPEILGGDPEAEPVPVSRLTTHRLRLAGGQWVGLAVGGRGIPLVVAHGLSFAGMLYVQSLSRLASMGFKVIAIDLAGHGGSAHLPAGGYQLDAYVRFLGRTIDELGVRRAVLVGHSLGGRLMAEVAGERPERTVALLLVDAALGRGWDRLAALSRYSPALLGLVGASLVSDTMATLFFSGDRLQQSKLQGLALPLAVNNLWSPWRLVAPALSVLFAPDSTEVLSRVRSGGVTTFIAHGDNDPVVPLAAAQDAATRAGADLFEVHGAGHSWLLEDPESLRSLVAELLGDGLGRACRSAMSAAGLDPGSVSMAEVEGAFYEPDAPVLDLAPDGGLAGLRPALPPRFRWSRLATAAERATA